MSLVYIIRPYCSSKMKRNCCCMTTPTSTDRRENIFKFLALNVPNRYMIKNISLGSHEENNNYNVPLHIHVRSYFNQQWRECFRTLVLNVPKHVCVRYLSIGLHLTTDLKILVHSTSYTHTHTHFLVGVGEYQTNNGKSC